MSITDSGRKGEAFPKALRLRRAGEFHGVYRSGEKRVSPSFAAFIISSNAKETRFGLTTPRKLGKAHERNRIRRRVREILRRDHMLFPRGKDIVLNPRRGALTGRWADLRAELRGLLRG